MTIRDVLWVYLICALANQLYQIVRAIPDLAEFGERTTMQAGAIAICYAWMRWGKGREAA